MGLSPPCIIGSKYHTGPSNHSNFGRSPGSIVMARGRRVYSAIVKCIKVLHAASSRETWTFVSGSCETVTLRCVRAGGGLSMILVISSKLSARLFSWRVVMVSRQASMRSRSRALLWEKMTLRDSRRKLGLGSGYAGQKHHSISKVVSEGSE